MAKFTNQSLGGKMRAEKLSKGERERIAGQGGEARAEHLQASERIEIARQGGLAKAIKHPKSSRPGG